MTDLEREVLERTEFVQLVKLYPELCPALKKILTQETKKATGPFFRTVVQQA